MIAGSTPNLTDLLSRIREGDQSAKNQLVPLVYGELQNLASLAFARQPGGHTLQPTALVHEVWLKLGAGLERFSDRRHFLAVASRAMRQILADHARALRTQKRAHAKSAVTLHEEMDPSALADIDVVELDDALAKLSRLNPRHARVVELRLFGSLTIAEVAESLSVSRGTVKADWTTARAWLRQELAG